MRRRHIAPSLLGVAPLSRIVLAVALALVAQARDARAAGPTFLSWGACNGASSAAAEATFDCDAGSGSIYLLVGTFGLTDALTGCFTLDANLDLTFPNAAAVPDFWKISGGACNQGGLLPGRTQPSDCGGHGASFFAGDTTLCDVIVSSMTIRGPNTLNLALTVSRGRTNLVDLEALPLRHFAFVLQFAMDNSPSCAGCSEPAAIAWNSCLIYSQDEQGADRAAVDALSDHALSQPCVAINGGGAACAITPVRRATWGALKALYR